MAPLRNVDFDLARALRRIEPEKWTSTLPPRSRDQLNFVDGAVRIGVPLLLDTCAYTDSLEAQLPPAAEALLKSRSTRHVSTVMGELSHLFGRLHRSSWIVACSPASLPPFTTSSRAI